MWIPISKVTDSNPVHAYSSAGLERTSDKREVDGSSPFSHHLIVHIGGP